MKNRETEELINIGKIGSSVGLRGEVRVTLYAQDSGNLKEGKVLLLKNTEKTLEAKCTGVRHQKDRPVIKLEGIADRNAADELRGMEVFIHEDQLEELPEGEHYVRDIIGYKVIDLAGRTEIGRLSDVIQNTAQSILEVERPAGTYGSADDEAKRRPDTVLIPAVDAFLKRIDDDNKVIEVELIPGFI